MTQEEIRNHLHMQAPVLGIRPEDRNSCILVKRQGVWRQPGARGLKPDELHYHKEYDERLGYASDWSMRS